MIHVSFSQHPYLASEERGPDNVTHLGSNEALVQTHVWLSSVSSSRKLSLSSSHSPLWHLRGTPRPAMHLSPLLDHKSRLGTSSSCIPSPSPKQPLDKFLQNEPNAKPQPFFLCGQALPVLSPCGPLTHAHGNWGWELWKGPSSIDTNKAWRNKHWVWVLSKKGTKEKRQRRRDGQRTMRTILCTETHFITELLLAAPHK